MSEPWYRPGCDCTACRDETARRKAILEEANDAYAAERFAELQRVVVERAIALQRQTIDAVEQLLTNEGNKLEDAAAGLTDRLDSHRETLHMHSKRIDQVHDRTMVLADRISDHDNAYAGQQTYLERLERRVASLEAQLRELTPARVLTSTNAYARMCGRCAYVTVSSKPIERCEICGQ